MFTIFQAPNEELSSRMLPTKFLKPFHQALRRHSMWSIFLSWVRSFPLCRITLMRKYQGYLVCIPISEDLEAGPPPTPDNWTVQVRVIISSGSTFFDFYKFSSEWAASSCVPVSCSSIAVPMSISSPLRCKVPLYSYHVAPRMFKVLYHRYGRPHWRPSLCNCRQRNWNCTGAPPGRPCIRPNDWQRMRYMRWIGLSAVFCRSVK